MGLWLMQSQKQTLSPQMIQSIEILQVASQELLNYLEKAVQENPILELQEYHNDCRDVESFQETQWKSTDSVLDNNNHKQGMQSAHFYQCQSFGRDETSLYDHLVSQLSALNLAPRQRIVFPFPMQPECLTPSWNKPCLYSDPWSQRVLGRVIWQNVSIYNCFAIPR